jgi:Zn-dependent protease
MFGTEKPIFQFRGPWGVPIQIGGSLMLLALIFVPIGGSSEMMFYGLISFAMLIASIFLHELGHAWGCLIQGIPVRRIMLFGGGGFCERSANATPYEEELIVAMGPIVNLAIWAVASLLAPMMADPTMAWALYWLSQMNLFLALFNLLPVMPLDGGKLFQLALMRFMPPYAATRLAGWVGLFMTVLWIPMMIWVYFTLGFVLFFIPPFALHVQMTRAAR